MSVNNLLVIGAFTNDILPSGVSIGGSAYFIANSLAHLDSMLTIITNSYELMKVVKYAAYVSCVYAPKYGSVFVFEIRESEESRKLKLIRKASSIDSLITDLINEWIDNGTRFRVAIVSPVFNEVSSEVVTELKKVADYVIVDIQGFVRECESGNSCKIVVNEQRFYELISIFSNSVDLIRGELLEFPKECRGDSIRKCVPGSVDVVQTNGPNDMYIYLGKLGKVARLHPLPGIEGSSVGAGDVFTGVLAYFIAKGFDLLNSCARAAVAAGLKVGRAKVPWFTLPELEVLSHKVLKHIKF